MPDDNARIYPCADCGTMRSKNEGGTVFTVCDECWEKLHPKPPSCTPECGETAEPIERNQWTPHHCS